MAKWQSKRDALMLSTKHDLKIVATGKRNRLNKVVMKPEIIICYNKEKQGIDILDQMASYFTPLRKTIRWYHKVAFEFMLSAAVVNALIVCQEITGNNVKIRKFRHDLIYALADVGEPGSARPSCALRTRPSTAPIHRPEEYEERDNRNRRKRRRCSKC